MRSPLARISRARFAVCAAACLAELLTPARASATHYVVDINGTGDFTSIQAALNAYQTTGWRESILVMPGHYPENLVFGTLTVVLGLEGAGATTVRGAAIEYFGGKIEGITFVEDVGFPYNINPGNALMKSCVFRSTVHGTSPSLDDCDFYGRTELYADIPGLTLLRSLRFHGATFYLRYYNGPLTLSDCSFEGPADTLLYIPSTTQGDPVAVRSCRFEGSRFGLVLGEGWDGRYEIDRCQFFDVSEVAIWHDNSDQWSAESNVDGGISNCRFERCGTAVHWKDLGGWGAPNPFGGGGSLYMGADTVLACRRDALVVGPIAALVVGGCVVEGSTGNGLLLHQERPAGEFNTDDDRTTRLVNSVFANSGGAGVLFEDSSQGAASFGQHPGNFIQSCTFSRNGGQGLMMRSVNGTVEHCVSFANGGDGFAVDSPAADWPARLISNTSALNRGDGYRLTGPTYAGDSLKLVQHNLAALNAGAGFRVPHQSFGSFAFNDAWSNYQGQYVGAWGSADSNLTVDPRFCDLGAGELGLQQGSPVGAGGIYGLIGALPEQCPNTTAVEPTAPQLSFAVRPTVARGSVEFVPPSAGPDGRIEIFDVTGRRHWGAAFGPTTGSMRWTGQSDNGHAQPGLYWVRFTRAGETQSQRLVWLR